MSVHTPGTARLRKVPSSADPDESSQPAELFEAVLNSLGIETVGDLEETPARWIKAFREMTAGYHENPSQILEKRFRQQTTDDLIIVQDISFASLCEHHLLPFSGVVHIAYLPNGFVAGVSKLARLVDCYAHRLQIQERMTQQIASAITQHLESRATGVIIRARHSCMECRGVKKPGARMTTSCLLGILRTDEVLRAEFLSLVSK
jgi:GTP cyclohydrolase I